MVALAKLNEIVGHIDKQCPVAEKFGHVGVGEGVVCSFMFNGQYTIFKVKGESHTESAPRQPKEIVVRDMSKIESVVDVVLPMWRLDQQCHLVSDSLNGGTVKIEQLGDFIRAVANDIQDECQSVLDDNGLTYKSIGAVVANRCKIYFYDVLTRGL